MSTIQILAKVIDTSRNRTLALLDKIRAEPDPAAVLGWRPGPGRAHIAWQLMHIAATEELFATERLYEAKKTTIPELVARYRGGSTPDDVIPSIDEIAAQLAATRANLLDTLGRLTDDQLSWVPPGLQARQLTVEGALHILPWHEGHHQGQAHITFNLFKVRGA